MNEFTTPFSLDLMSFKPFCALVPELRFTDIPELPETGPFVYVIIEPRGGIVHIGKIDSETKTVALRSLAFTKWSADYLMRISEGGHPDPMYDPENGNMDLTLIAPIIRFLTRHGAIVRAASVASTGVNAKQWEARLQTLSGTLTGLESVLGGSAWEANTDTLRGDGYEWAAKRIEQHYAGTEFPYPGQS